MADILKSGGIQDPATKNLYWQGEDEIRIDDYNASIDNSLALNAIPTPFARPKILEQAFRILNRHREDESKAGNVYRQLVSDCLDVFEILFNYDSHQGEIEIIPVSISGMKFPSVNTVNKARRSLLKDSLTQFPDYDLQHLIVYDQGGIKRVIAGTSPETVFFTTPRLDRKEDRSHEYDLEGNKFMFARPGNCGYYFSRESGDRVRPLSSRSQEFKSYMKYLVETNALNLASTELGKYLRSLPDDVVPTKDPDKALKPIMVNGEPLVVHGIPVMANARVSGDNLFNDHVIRLAMDINGEKFRTISPEGGANGSMLLPFNMEKIAQVLDNTFDTTEIKSTISLQSAVNNISFGEYKKEIAVEQCPLAFDMGIYPFFSYPEESKKKRYDLILAYRNEGGPLKLDYLTCKFYRIDEGRVTEIPRKQTDNDKYYFVDTVRTDEKYTRTGETLHGTENESERTIHYRIEGTNIDFIELEFRLPHKKEEVLRGVLIPRFKTLTGDNTGKELKVAVDFGTTSTYLACKEGDNKAVTMVTPEQSMVFLHRSDTKNKTLNASVYEHIDFTDPEDMPEGKVMRRRLGACVALIKNEFIPSFIGNSDYAFPIRTAVSEGKSPRPEMFGKTNIAFTYEKEDECGSNKFIPNLKWDTDRREQLESFIEELLHICVMTAYEKGFSPDTMKILRFLPLSMDHDRRTRILDTWNKCLEKTGIPAQNVSDLTELLAPYYRLHDDGGVADAQSVASIDIGGGTVDFTVFEHRTPKYASSAMFGCDVLWGSGKTKSARNSKENAIYDHFREDCTIRLREKPALSAINATMSRENSDYSATDIINFWITNSEQTKILSGDGLNQTKYHPIYICHISAILYHIAQTMKAKGMDKPLSGLVFSGNGSSYLHFLGSDKLKDITIDIFDHVLGAGHVVERDILTVFISPNGKQATALGGLRMNVDVDHKLQPFVYLGADPSEVKINGTVDRKEVTTSREIQDAVVSNVSLYIRLLEQLLKKHWDIKNVELRYENSDVLRSSLLEILSDSALMGNGNISSSLFFLPLRQSLYTLAKQLFN